MRTAIEAVIRQPRTATFGRSTTDTPTAPRAKAIGRMGLDVCSTTSTNAIATFPCFFVRGAKPRARTCSRRNASPQKSSHLNRLPEPRFAASTISAISPGGLPLLRFFVPRYCFIAIKLVPASLASGIGKRGGISGVHIEPKKLAGVIKPEHRLRPLGRRAHLSAGVGLALNRPWRLQAEESGQRTSPASGLVSIRPTRSSLHAHLGKACSTAGRHERR